MSANEVQFLRVRYSRVVCLVGAVLTFCGAWMLVPLLVLPFRPNEWGLAGAFFLPAGVTIMAGLLMWGKNRSALSSTISGREGGLIVLISWLLVSAVSAIPLAWAGGLSPLQAFFESVSGWTTTGLSVVDVEQAPLTVLLWRSLMQLAGGAGLAIVMLSALTRTVGIGLSTAEGRTDQLVPHVKRSARLVLIIYTAYAIVGVILYHLVGMHTFDAINHTFAAISTGGFSTKSASIGHWDSPSVEAVTCLLMVLGSLNFATAWLFISGKWESFWRNREIRLFAVLLALSVALVWWAETSQTYTDTTRQVRVALFEMTTALTTTGFSTVSYTVWHSAGVLLLLILMLVGGSFGSTAGGLKLMRVYLLLRTIGWELRKALLPSNAILPQHMPDKEKLVRVDSARIQQLAAFTALYLGALAVGSIILACHGYPMSQALFEMASGLGTVGLSSGITAASAPPAVLLVLTVGMLLGRLEFVVVITSGILLLSDAFDFSVKTVTSPHSSAPTSEQEES